MLLNAIYTSHNLNLIILIENFVLNKNAQVLILKMLIKK